VKIQDGCDRFCSFCIISRLRGALASKPEQDALDEAVALAAQGYRELVLTGIHISSYGKDRGETPEEALPRLIEGVCRVPGVSRVRLGSLEPTVVTPALARRLAGCGGALCPQFHLSLQSGCAATLQRMNRRYSPEQYALAAQLLRDAFPADCAITTDVIAGFPGETDEEFEESLAFCRRMGFARMHVFRFSAREGTPAATMPEQVPAAAKARRAERMGRLASEMAANYHRLFIGRTVEILVERATPAEAEGLTASYARVRATIPQGAPPPARGSVVPARVAAADADGLTGVLLV